MSDYDDGDGDGPSAAPNAREEPPAGPDDDGGEPPAAPNDWYLVGR